MRVDESYLRPTEVDELCGDASKARTALGWEAAVRFPELVRIMLASDLAEVGLDPAAHIRAAHQPTATNGPTAAAAAPTGQR